MTVSSHRKIYSVAMAISHVEAGPPTGGATCNPLATSALDDGSHARLMCDKLWAGGLVQTLGWQHAAGMSTKSLIPDWGATL